MNNIKYLPIDTLKLIRTVNYKCVKTKSYKINIYKNVGSYVELVGIIITFLAGKKYFKNKDKPKVLFSYSSFTTFTNLLHNSKIIPDKFTTTKKKQI